MSFSKPVKRHNAHASGKQANFMKSSPPQAEVVEVSRNTSPGSSLVHKSGLPDSGFFESADDDVDLPSHCCSKEDWILYADEDIPQDEGYFFQEEEATDIGSVKANHGSAYNGNNNEDGSLISSTSSSSSRRSQPLHVTYESPRRNDPPPHVFTHHPETQPSVTNLNTWMQTPERHEVLAYYLEQPLNPGYRFHDAQYYWDGEIDLSRQEVRR